MKRQMITIVIAALMICGMLSVTSYAADPVYVAQVGSTKYEDIDTAIENWTNNTTLTLLADVTLSNTVTLKSTEHHTLDLSTFTMTAASGKNAFVIKACGTGDAERYALTITADASDPGTLDAGKKSCVYYKYADGDATGNDRPIIRIQGGIFVGSTSSFGSAGFFAHGSAARKCATFNISGGTFNCSIIGTGKSKMLIYGGTFNYTVSSQGDSTCYRLISGGKFKTLGFMTADAPNKFGIGSALSNYDKGVYIDDEGYLVVGGPVVTEPGTQFEASTTSYSSVSSYLKYSSAASNQLYYTSAEEALKKNKGGNFTIYTDELDLSEIGFKGNLYLTEDNDTLEATFDEGSEPAWDVDTKETGKKVFYKDTVALGKVTRTYILVDATLPTAKSGLVYSKASQALVTAGSVDGYTVKYALGANDSDIPDANWTDTVPETADAGEYYVWYKIVGADSSEYLSQDGQCFKVTVAQKEIGITWSSLTSDELIYSGTEKVLTATATGVIDGDVCEILTEVVGDNKLIGSFYYKAIGVSNDNYVLPADVESPSYTITAKGLTIVADDKEMYKGEDRPQLTYTVYGLADGETLGAEPILSTNANINVAGVYEITLSGISASDNYEVTIINGTFIVKNLPYYTQLPLYEITVADDIEGGTVTVGNASVYNGNTIFVTVAAQEGYVFDKLIITEEDGFDVEIIELSATEYAFKMPADDVIIDAEFLPEEKEPEYVADCDKDEECPMHSFEDLELGEWYHDGIHYCIDNGYMQGTDEETFSPDTPITRAMFVTILWRLEKEPMVEYDMSFTDVKEDEWYTEAVRWASSIGIVLGYNDETFGTEDEMTREQLITFMYRYAEYKGCDVSEFGNISTLSAIEIEGVSEWALPAMRWAYSLGILTDAPQDPDGDASVKRSEAAVMIYKMASYIEENAEEIL